MRRYNIVFLEHKIGAVPLGQLDGADGMAFFAAEDDEAALAHVERHLTRQMAQCVKAELSSMALVADHTAGGGTRLVDDSLANPHFQEMRLHYDLNSKKIEVDFESTRTTILADKQQLRRANPYYRKM